MIGLGLHFTGEICTSPNTSWLLMLLLDLQKYHGSDNLEKRCRSDSSSEKWRGPLGQLYLRFLLFLCKEQQCQNDPWPLRADVVVFACSFVHKK